jgi:tetratricopeptide (TPR) repeat protein
MCAMALRDAVLGGAPLDCQEAVRRSGRGDVGEGELEAACREQYFAMRDPEDGLALARALLRRGELRGAAAVAQGLLRTPARADSLLLLSRVASQERRFEEAERALAAAAALHERLERKREAAHELFELAELRMTGRRPAAALRAFERAERLARQVGDAALVEACAAAARRAEAAEAAGAIVEDEAEGEGERPGGAGMAPSAPASAR